MSNVQIAESTSGLYLEMM